MSSRRRPSTQDDGASESEESEPEASSDEFVGEEEKEEEEEEEEEETPPRRRPSPASTRPPSAKRARSTPTAAPHGAAPSPSELDTMFDYLFAGGAYGAGDGAGAVVAAAPEGARLTEAVLGRAFAKAAGAQPADGLALEMLSIAMEAQGGEGVDYRGLTRDQFQAVAPGLLAAARRAAPT